MVNTIKIEHVAIWVRDIERTRQFFERHFGTRATERYNNAKGFSSYFLTFPEENMRLEIMQSKEMPAQSTCLLQPTPGMGHIAISVGLKENVDEITCKLVNDSHQILSGPRTTGDGYYESSLCIFNDFILELTI